MKLKSHSFKWFIKKMTLGTCQPPAQRATDLGRNARETLEIQFSVHLLGRHSPRNENVKGIVEHASVSTQIIKC